MYSVPRKVKVLVAQSCPALCDLMDRSLQAPLSLGFSRQAYGNGLPFPSPGDLPDAGIKSRSPALRADSLPSEPPGKLTTYHQITTLVVQTVKKLPAMWETCIPSLGQEDLLEKGMATHSSILAWEIPWTEARDRL